MTLREDEYILKFKYDDCTEFYVVEFNSVESWRSDYYPLIIRDVKSMENTYVFSFDFKKFTLGAEISVVLPDDPELFVHLL